MSGEEQVTTGTPTSWRDVYALVQDSERRLTATITAGFNRQAAVSQDHEVRIRVLEASDQRDGATNKSTVAAISVTRAIILGVVSVLSLVVAITSLFIHAGTP